MGIEMIESIKRTIQRLDNPAKTYFNSGIVKCIEGEYYIFFDNPQLVEKYSEGTYAYDDVMPLFKEQLGITLKARHIKDMPENDGFNSEEIELVKAFRNMDESQKALVRKLFS